LNKSKILVVEDECITAMEIRKLLESSGYKPYTASSSEDAVKKAVEIKPDLILMDIKIKGENDGIKAAEKIKEFLEVPIIYLTAHADEKILESAKSTNPCSYVLKPFERVELISNIEIALHNKRNAKLNSISNKELGNICTFYGELGAQLASSMPFKEKSNFLIQFSRFFEDNMKAEFINCMENLKSNNENEILNVYLACLSSMLSKLGFTNNRMSSGSKGYLIITKCPWRNEKHSNDIFCLVCQSITQITLSYVDLEGEVNQESSFLSGATFCRFKFQLK
jgi:CheY-like chemotaxis protein